MKLKNEAEIKMTWAHILAIARESWPFVDMSAPPIAVGLGLMMAITHVIFLKFIV